MTESATPLMRQYHAVKRQHPQTLLLFRLGDFYELFYEDAVVASRVLQITLTSRHRESGKPVPMCGVPYHSAESYIARLLRAGHRVAICEQMEDPAKLKGRKLVRREVVRVITPGTATEFQLLEPKENNFLAAVAWSNAGPAAGLAYVDVSTGEFRSTEWTGPEARLRLEDELAVLRPRELLLPRPATLFAESLPLDLSAAGSVSTRLDDWVFREDYAERLLREQLGVVSLDGFGLSGHHLAVAACGAVLHYLRETSAKGGGSLQHLDRVVYYDEPGALVLDSVTTRNLELLEPAAGDPRGPTLFSTLDETGTPLGARLLRNWILRPAIERAEIEARLDAVAELKVKTVAREEIRGELSGVLDLERLTSRVALSVVTPRELVALRHSLERIPILRARLEPCESPRLAELRCGLDELADVRARIAAAIAEEPPAVKAYGPAEPGVIRPGYNAELDDLRALGTRSRQIIAAMEERERKRSGIASLKIRFNQVFGYYIEVSKPNLHLVPPDFERKQTLVNAERFTMPELKEYERKVLDADERILEIEQRLFAEAREWIAAQAPRLRRTSAALAQLDVLAAFAHLAATRNFVRPEFAPPDAADPGSGGELLLAGARHPVIEKLLEERGERFVPNDLYLDAGSHLILLITGPNMGGKSTYLRQAALLVLMAQMGSFVPAQQARLPLIDRIFTRIGASDNLARGRSTFLVEMAEVAAILNLATPRSLVLLDEVGRGTATFDGLAIAWAVVEHLHARTRARTLFATHYHELTELGRLLSGVKNVHVSVKEAGGDIVFLRRVEPGSANKSYGIEVARLAGLPRPVIERAREILAKHEQKEHKLSAELSPGAEPGPAGSTAPLPVAEQQPMFTPLDREVLEALRKADLENLRPIDALNLLAKLKDQVS